MTIPKDTLRASLCSGDEEKLYDTIVDIGKHRVESLGADVVPFLSHPSAELRVAAAQTVGFHLQMRTEGETLLRMTTDDPDEDVRRAALFGWAGLFAGTRNRRVLRQLAAWLDDPSWPKHLRATAFWGILSVGGLPRERRPRTVDFDEVDPALVRQLVNEILDAGLG